MKQQHARRRHDRFVLGNAMAEKLDARFICVAYLLLTRSRTRLLALSVLASLPGLRSSTFYSVRHVRARVRVHLRRVTADNNNASKDETAARLDFGNARKTSSEHEDSRTHHEAQPEFHEGVVLTPRMRGKRDWRKPKHCSSISYCYQKLAR